VCCAGLELGGELVGFGASEPIAAAVLVPGDDRVAGVLLRAQPVTELKAGHAQLPGDLVGSDLFHGT
jgi:hypothetical protein